MPINGTHSRTPVGGEAVARPHLASWPRVPAPAGPARVLSRLGCMALAAAAAAGTAVRADAADVRLSAPACAMPGTVMEVALIVDPEGASVVGLQALLQFDASVLRLLSFEQGDAPYVVPIWSSCDPVTAHIDVAVGFDPASGQTQSPVSVAKRMRFEVLPGASECATAGLIGFREDPPFKTLLTAVGGAGIEPDLAQLGPLTIAPPPTIADPDDLSLTPPPKMDCVVPSLVPPQASSMCGTEATVTFVRSDGATSLSAPLCRMYSPLTVTWTATDACGRAVSASQMVTVQGIPGDLNSDNSVDAYDLAVNLGAWGSTTGVGDLTGDLAVDGTDLSVLLSRWTDVIP